mgnify:CR=1 FL=1
MAKNGIVGRTKNMCQPMYTSSNTVRAPPARMHLAITAAREETLSLGIVIISYMAMRITTSRLNYHHEETNSKKKKEKETKKTVNC